ncbi:CPBP family intramembrane glutamic endopeptidase [Candidatus Methanomassiliicoccus intestinalis]|uniref:CPBP family intramembrane glutamic endopeptidase n=1 Tax=Candidatus Methanomassiliicoccus intestinalis TaxID=1406512 RepID=UPI0037DC79FE
MNKKAITIMAILTTVIAFMEISGLPSALFIDLHFADITPFIFSQLVNFLFIGALAFLVIKTWGKGWFLGFTRIGLAKSFKKYAPAGIAAGVLSCVAFCVGLMPFDYQPSFWKILIEGIVYYIGVAIIEELYLRGLLLNIIEKLAYKKSNSTVIAIWVTSVIFGLGHIFGVIGMGIPVIVFKVVSTTGMGLYFGTIYKKTNNLWLPIIIHGFIDICALPYCFTTYSGYPTISLIMLTIIYVLLGIYSVIVMKRKA